LAMAWRSVSSPRAGATSFRSAAAASRT
jgi:hypothetical protein